MRALTAEEKAASEVARKRVNKVFAARRMEIGQKLRKLPITAARSREELHEQFRSLRDIKGQPVILLVDDIEIVLDYGLYRRLIKTLKHRYWRQEIRSNTLHITHYHGSNGGVIELHALPQYQQDLLTDLPIILD